MPYFCVLSDTSTVDSATLQSSHTQYPEIRYVFLDDPHYSQLEETVPEDEEAIILDLDPQGQQVQRWKCVNDDMCVMGVKMKDKDGIKTIEIDVTRSELDGLESVSPTPDVDELKKMVELFQKRNEQLMKVANA